MLTKLDAVNIMLDAIGESPVQSLESGLGDAETAERMLDRISKQHQLRGWHCNTEVPVTLTRDSSLHIRLPLNCLKVDTVAEDFVRDVTQRDGRLYDRDNRTFVFDKDLKVEIVYELQFNELPPVHQLYVAYLAAQHFQQISPTSMTLDQMVSRNVFEAWNELLVSEEEVKDANMLRDNRHAAEMTYRRSYRRRSL